MAAICSHKDEERQGVSFTAHLIALYRAKETEREHPLFVDPFAQSLTGKIGYDWYDANIEVEKTNIAYVFSLVSTRTSFIDRFLFSNLATSPPAEHNFQVCVLGAGLDARPWRIKSPAGSTSGYADISYFEVDFPEIFEYKLPIIESLNGTSEFNYHSVQADLSLPTWPEHLLGSGFDATKPTVWILEGIAMYLTPAEIDVFLTRITQLSAKG